MIDANPSAEGFAFSKNQPMSYRAKLRSYFHSRDRGWILSLLAAACALYLPFWGNPFFFDDLSFFLGGVASKYAQSGFHLDLRWLPHATLGWTEALSTNAVTELFHAGNLLLHASNTILLFYLLRLLAGSVAPDGKSSNTVIWGAWFGALIFALHPVAVYAVGYVVQRSILMATFFALVTQLAYLRGLLSGQARWLALAAAAYFLAVFSKEHSVMVPALLGAETILLRAQIRASARSLGLAWGALLLIGLLIILRARGVFGTPYEAMAADLFRQEGIAESTAMLHLLSAMTQAGLFFKYLLLWVAPNPAWMSIDMREPFISSWLSWQGLLGLAGFAAYGALGVWLLLRPRWAGLAGLALLYPWLQFVLEFASIRVQEPFVLYRSYLWMPGLALLVPLLLSKWPGRKTFFALVLAALLLVPAAVNRLWVFADPYRLWNDAALLLPDEKTPGADRIFYNRGQAAEAANNLDMAIEDFRRVVALSPQLAPPHYQLGMAYFKAGRYREAIEQFDAESALNPNAAVAYFGKGLALMGLHEGEQAAVQMKQSCKLGYWLACWVQGDPKHGK